MLTTRVSIDDNDDDESNKIVDNKSRKISVKNPKRKNTKKTTAPTSLPAKGKSQKKKTSHDGREKPNSYRPRPGSQYMTAPPDFTEIEDDNQKFEKEPENRAKSETDHNNPVEVVDKY